VSYRHADGFAGRGIYVAPGTLPGVAHKHLLFYAHGRSRKLSVA
jgi:hypothetical protein